MDDDELLRRFLAGRLDSFPHRDHLRVAFLLLASSEFDEATELMSSRIRAMAVEAGNADKFHVTRTVAWMRLVQNARAANRAPSTSEEFLLRHPDLLRSTLLDDYYSALLLASEAARAAFIEPDLTSLSSVS